MLESSLEGSLESSLESSSGSARRETNHSLHRTQELSVRTAARRWSPAAGACVCIAPLAQRQRPPPPPRPASRSPRTYSRWCREVPHGRRVCSQSNFCVAPPDCICPRSSVAVFAVGGECQPAVGGWRLRHALRLGGLLGAWFMRGWSRRRARICHALFPVSATTVFLFLLS